MWLPYIALQHTENKSKSMKVNDSMGGNHISSSQLLPQTHHISMSLQWVLNEGVNTGMLIICGIHTNGCSVWMYDMIEMQLTRARMHLACGQDIYMRYARTCTESGWAPRTDYVYVTLYIEHFRCWHVQLKRCALVHIPLLNTRKLPKLTYSRTNLIDTEH